MPRKALREQLAQPLFIGYRAAEAVEFASQALDRIEPPILTPTSTGPRERAGAAKGR